MSGWAGSGVGGLDSRAVLTVAVVYTAACCRRSAQDML